LGTTTVTASGAGPPPPAAFQLGTPAIYYDVQTTASYGGPVTLCLPYGPTTFPDPGLARLLHYEAGGWLNVTISNDTTSFIICGVTMGLSPFAIFAAPNEPVFLIDELIHLVRSLHLQAGTENRLAAALPAVRDALEDVKNHSIERTCMKMKAFSDVVAAESRTLTVRQSKQLLGGASGVRSSLRCP
jgi:hypothetical protein